MRPALTSRPTFGACAGGMAVARHHTMKLITKLLVLGSAVTGTGYLAYRQRKHHAGPIGEKPTADQDFGMIPDADIIEEIVIVGIAEVDPEANQAAHEGVRDPRDRLPRTR